jgi:hypothetical protein
MQLSYRGRQYTPVSSEIPTTTQSFQGQFRGRPATFTTTYRSSMPDATVPLIYRGQHYLGDR